MTTPKKPPKLSSATVNAVEAMWKALPELQTLMHPEDFAELYGAVEQARTQIGVVTMVTPHGVIYTDPDLPIEDRTFKRKVATMHARQAFLGIVTALPPPDEVHWGPGREPKSRWARRYVKIMELLGYSKTQAFEAAPETRSDRPGRRRSRPEPVRDPWRRRGPTRRG